MNKAIAREQGSVAGLLLVVMTIGFIIAGAFGVWAFAGMQANKTNLDQKIAKATEAAVAEAETKKEKEFTEREKNPYRNYRGSSTYGSLTFDFPKSWNVYAVEKTTGTLLDFYCHPGLIPGLEKDVNFAFRTQIVDTAYEKEADKMASLIKNGKVKAEPFRPEKVDSELGLRVTGEIVSGKKGVMILLPQRDKTIKMWTETEEYLTDFEKILESMTFEP